MTSLYEKYNMKEYQIEWREKNRIKFNNYHSKYRDKHRNKISEYHKKYYYNYYHNNLIEQREKRKMYMRKYRDRKKNNMVNIKVKKKEIEIVIEKKVELIKPKVFNKEYRNIVLTF